MASITSWVRIEPRSRDVDLLVGVEARLHDPVWLLARQWQLGELDGVDAGSAIFARTRAHVARVDAWRVAGGTWQSLDPDTTPLDAALAPARSETSARPKLLRRARVGQQLFRMLTAAHVGGYRSVFLARYPLTVSDGERATLDDADARFLDVLARRVPDGDTAAAALRPLIQIGDLPGDFGIAATDVHSVSAVCGAWLAWLDAFEHVTSTPAWQPEQLAYSFEARVAATPSNLHLVAARLEGDASSWCDFDVAIGDPTERSPTRIVSTSLPVHVRYRGMPARRYWELEDAAVRWSSIDAGPGDVARLLFVEFGLTLADHWLFVPVSVPAGSVNRVSSLVVTDTFGIRTLIRSAAEIDGPTSPWCFLQCSRSKDVPGPLLLIPPAATVSSGRALDAIDFARDDVGNLLWALERTVLGADGRPRDVTISQSSVPAPTTLTYRVGPSVPPAFHPYRSRVDSDGLVLALAAVPGEPARPRPDLPTRVRAHSLPSATLRLTTRAEVTRASDGSYHVVSRRDRGATSVPPSPSLAFDRLEDGGEANG